MRSWAAEVRPFVRANLAAGPCAAVALWILATVSASAAPTPNETPTPMPSATPSIPEAQTVDPTTPTRDLTLVSAYTGSSYAPGDLRLWQFVPREEVLRLGKSLLRASLPRWESIEGGPSGWGDAQAFYLFAKSHKNSRFGVGASMWFPTASNPKLGTGKWSIGPSFGYAVLDFKSRMFTGFLTQSFFSFAGSSSRRPQSLVLFQPILIKQLGSGWSFRSVDANWTFDLERGSTVIPVSVGFGKLVSLGQRKFNFALADEVTIVHANAPLAPKNTLKLTISVIIPR